MHSADEARARVLGEHILELATQIHIATQRLHTLIREFDHIEGWRDEGYRNCADWLSTMADMSPTTAYEHVRVARALGDFPDIDEAFQAGMLSYSNVRALTRVARPENVKGLVAGAVEMTGGDVERMCRGIRIREESRGLREKERYVRQRTRGDGMVELTLQLTADEAELVQKALREAKNSSAGEFEAGAKGDRRTTRRSAKRTEESARADAMVELARSYLEGGERGPKSAERTQLLVHLRVENSPAEESPRSSALVHDSGHESGHWLSQQAFERLSCDCAITAVRTDTAGQVLSVGRKRRTIPPAIRAAMLVRDGECTFPGCSHTAFLEGHHIEHWSRDGETSLENLTLLCHYHHKLLHEDGFTVERVEGRLSFANARGVPVREA